jgi:hypothetical protein
MKHTQDACQQRKDKILHMNEEVVYLAAPFSHPDENVLEQRFESINRAAHYLFNKGVAVISPISQCWPIAKQCGMRTDFEWWSWYNGIIISRCNKLIVLKLDGWLESIGVQGEIKIAKELGSVQIEYMEPV